MFRVWQRSDLLSREMNLADYMVTAVRNAALTALRTDSRLRQRHDGLAAELVVTGTRVELPPLDDPHDWNDEIDELRRVVGTLTEHQRTAFTLRYSLGMTNQQIAGELGISLKGAEQLTARLMKLLRERVKLPPQ